MFKKLLAYLLIISLLLPAIPVRADDEEVWPVTLVASGTVTQANMRISTAAGVSFVDFSAATVLTSRLGYLLKIKDSAGKVIQGFVRNAGTAEGLGDEILADPSFDADASWQKLTGWTVSGGNAIANNPAVDYRIWQVFTKTAGQLYKGSAVVSALTAGAMRFNIGNVAVGNFTSAATITGYATVTGVVNGIYGLAANTAGDLQAAVASLGFKQVLTPSATGVTISSTKGGTSLDNWAAKDSAFNYNDASGYSYELWKVNNAVVIASGSLAAGEVKASMVSGGATASGGAFCDPVGLNLAPYADGKHILWLQDSSNYVAFGKMKEAGGGEGFGAEKLTGDASTFTAGVGGWGTWYGTNSIAATGGKGRCDYTNGGLRGPAATTLAVGCLSKVITKATAISSTTSIRFGDGNLLPLIFTITGVETEYSGYFTQTYTGYLTHSGTPAGVWDLDDITWKQVLTPSATGAVITDAAGLYNWMQKHASFNPNLACSYKILYIGDN